MVFCARLEGGKGEGCVEEEAVRDGDSELRLVVVRRRGVGLC